MEAMLDRLYSSGKANFVRDLKLGLYTLPWLYAKDLSGELETLVTSTTLRPLAEIHDWVLNHPQLAETTKRTYRVALAKALKGWPTASVHDMPQVLAAYRQRCEDDGTKRTFNLARSAFQSFATAIDGRHKPLWISLSNVRPIRYKADSGKKLTYEDAMTMSWELASTHRDGLHHVQILWSLLLSGMRRAEYLAGWTVYDQSILVESQGKQKQSGQASRSIPRVSHTFKFSLDSFDRWYRYDGPHGPESRFTTFERRLRKLSDGKFSCHDLRHTFRTWCMLAGVPEVRAEAYMGHKAKASDMSALYTVHDVMPYLEADAAAISRYLNDEWRKWYHNRHPQSVDYVEPDNDRPIVRQHRPRAPRAYKRNVGKH